MKESNAQFVGSIPEIYHAHLGPLLFEPYAADLVSRLQVPAKPGAEARVLEIAAGTGIVTRMLRQALPPQVTLVATDLNEPMLDVGRENVGKTQGIEWQQADATALPFPDQSFDAIVCQFGVMFFPDKDQAAREAFRVLRPGGVFLFNVWGSMEENPFARTMHETVASFFQSDPPDFYQVPFGYHDPGTIRSTLERAGFERIEVTEVEKELSAPSAEHAAIGFVRGNPILLAIQERGTAEPDAIVAAVAKAQARSFGDRPLRFRSRVRVISARRPS